MSRAARLTTGLIICAVILVAAVTLGFGGIFQAMGFTYENAKKYTAGEADISDPVKNLDIEWINGTVRIQYHNENTILLREESKKKISKDMEMRWWMDGDTLRVQYAKSGFRMMGFWNQEKELTVTLPEEIGFGDVVIGATSGDLEIPELKAENLSLEVTSGDINASADAAKISVGATSGDISVKTAEDTEKISVATTSGNISVEAENVDEVKAGCTSGGISVRLGKFETLKVSSTSGDVTAYLPEEPGFTAELDTTSGDVKYSLPLSKEGSAYVCGDGSGTVKIGTTSGDVRIEAFDE